MIDKVRIVPTKVLLKGGDDMRPILVTWHGKDISGEALSFTRQNLEALRGDLKYLERWLDEQENEKEATT